MDVLRRCDHKMLRIVAEVRWQRCVQLKTFLLSCGKEN